MCLGPFTKDFAFHPRKQVGAESLPEGNLQGPELGSPVLLLATTAPLLPSTLISLGNESSEVR